jgi:ferrous iron transport protein A
LRAIARLAAETRSSFYFFMKLIANAKQKYLSGVPGLNMSDRTQIPLSQMPAGQSAIVVQIHGGHGLMRRLGSLGIRRGQRITKVSSMLMRGPVTIRVGNSQVAIGFGIANKILVELEQA